MSARSITPASVVRLHTYVSSLITLNAVTGTTAFHVFSCNDLVDTNKTGPGHQPYGFDQMALLYSSFRVLRVTCTVDFKSLSDASGTNFVGLQVSNAQTLVNPEAHFNVESPHTVYKTLGGLTFPGRNNVRLRMNLIPYKFLRVKPFTQDYNGTDISSPALQCFFIIFTGAQSVTGDPGNVGVTVHLTFTARWSESKVQQASI